MTANSTFIFWRLNRGRFLGVALEPYSLGRWDLRQRPYLRGVDS